MTLLNVNQLHFAYGDRTIFDQVSFDLEPGQIMTILGPNGVGKSTLLSCLTNQLKEANGQININDPQGPGSTHGPSSPGLPIRGPPNRD